MSTHSEIQDFIQGYTPVARERIAFTWNGKHAEGFEDPNMEFRGEVIHAVVDGTPAAPQLLADLFDEETSFSVEAWGATDGLAPLARRLLIEGGTEHVLTFIRGKWKSFDTEMACADMAVPMSCLRSLQAYCASKATVNSLDGEAYAVGEQYFSELLAQDNRDL